MSRAREPHTVCRPRLRCSQLFMIFQGNVGRLMLPALDFIRLTGMHDRNLIMFRDTSMRNYQTGLSSEISSWSKFLDWQREQRDLYFPHIRTTYCVGTSAGAYAAIVSGYFLRSPIVWAFAPPTTRFDSITQDNVADPVSEACRDLVTLLRRGNGVTEYRIFYNDGSAMDNETAEALGECEGVRLFPQPGDHHSVVLTMRQMNRLENLIVPFEAV